MQIRVHDRRRNLLIAIGTEAVVKSAPDGQTLLITTNAGITINPLLYKQMVNPMDGLATRSDNPKG